jgi:hypothetical protein
MRVTREEYLAYLEDLGCGPPAGSSSADVEAWGRELEELKTMVTKGLGICLNVPYSVVPSSTAEPCVTSQRGEVTGGVRVVEWEEASYSPHFEKCQKFQDNFPQHDPGSTPGLRAVAERGVPREGNPRGVTVSHGASLGADLTVEDAHKREVVALVEWEWEEASHSRHFHDIFHFAGRTVEGAHKRERERERERESEALVGIDMMVSMDFREAHLALR